MKILIVDDEPIIRDSLRHIIEHSSLGIQTVLSTSDPGTAMSLLEKEQPEILLTDIQMPRITGLDLARFVHEREFLTKIIFITGYSDFEYARAGIQYCVSDYLLKPVDETEAIACIRRVMQSQARALKHTKMYELFQSYFSTHFEAVQRQFLERLLFYPLTWSKQSLVLQQKEMRLDFPYFFLGSVTLLTLPKYAVEESYYIYMAEQYFNNSHKEVITLPSGNVLYLLWPVEGSFDDLLEAVLSTARLIKSDLEHQYPIQILMGFSQLAQTFEQMQLLRRQTRQCLEYAKVHSSQEIVFYDDFANTVKEEQYFDISYLVTELVGYLRIGDNINVNRLLVPLSSQLNKQPVDIAENTLQLFVSHILYFVNDLALPPRDLSHIRSTAETRLHAQSSMEMKIEYFSYWTGYICDSIQGLQSSEQNSLIASVYDYINRYYAKPIGLTDVSESINRNPSYVSRLMKQCTEKNFSQILTEKRIEEAKKLLRDPALRLADIAAQTGYPNLRYFTRVFHTQVNMSPNDYRKIITAFK